MNKMNERIKFIQSKLIIRINFEKGLTTKQNITFSVRVFLTFFFDLTKPPNSHNWQGVKTQIRYFFGYHNYFLIRVDKCICALSEHLHFHTRKLNTEG